MGPAINLDLGRVLTFPDKAHMVAGLFSWDPVFGLHPCGVLLAYELPHR